MKDYINKNFYGNVNHIPRHLTKQHNYRNNNNKNDCDVLFLCYVCYVHLHEKQQQIYEDFSCVND